MVDSNARLLGGRYEVRSLIGRGGMATVHLGRDTRLSRLVAIKMLRTDLARDSIFQTRFRREAQAAASLNHPNIVAVYDTGEEPARGPDGKTIMVPYIVMEYVEGHTVKELLSDGTPVPIPEAVEITQGVLAALDYAHNAGLVHRDIKPGNVMLTNTGKVKVMDFGIARAIADSQATMTSANAVVGTALYLSPEQARGEKIDERSDVYSAGCVLFELLTGRAPFVGDSAVSLAYQHVSELPPVPSSIAADVPASLDQVVMKALAKDPDQRYASAADMSADLNRAAAGLNTQAPPVTAWVAPDTTAATQIVSTPASSAATQTLAYTGPTRSGAASQPSQYAMNPSVMATGAIPVQQPRKKKSRAGLFWTLLLVLLAAGVVAGLVYTVWNSGKNTQQSEMTAVPTGIIGLSETQAKNKIESAGLVFALGDEVADPNIEKGKIAAVDPEEGLPIEVGGTVTVHASAGPASIAVPDVVNESVDNARTLIEQAGFTVGDVTVENSPTVPKDHVIRTDPAGGTIRPRGDVVNVVTSSGMVDVPGNLIGADEATARTTLGQYNLKIKEVIRQASSAPAGTVIWIDPSDATVPQGTEITLGIAQACPAGQTFSDEEGQCVTPPPTLVCPEGYHLVGSECVADEPKQSGN